MMGLSLCGRLLDPSRAAMLQHPVKAGMADRKTWQQTQQGVKIRGLQSKAGQKTQCSNVATLASGVHLGLWIIPVMLLLQHWLGLASKSQQCPQVEESWSMSEMLWWAASDECFLPACRPVHQAPPECIAVNLCMHVRE
jgi:hypothetical protein